MDVRQARWRPAHCPQLIKAWRSGTDTAVRCDIGSTHGGREHPVTECDVAKPDRLAQMRIFHNRFTLNDISMNSFHMI